MSWTIVPPKPTYNNVYCTYIIFCTAWAASFIFLICLRLWQSKGKSIGFFLNKKENVKISFLEMFCQRYKYYSKCRYSVLCLLIIKIMRIANQRLRWLVWTIVIFGSNHRNVLFEPSQCFFLLSKIDRNRPQKPSE